MISDSASKKVKVKRMLVTLASVVIVTALILVVILSRVDDWKRDLSTNVATTSENSQSHLQPLRLPVSVNDATEKLRSAVADMSNWQWTKDTKSDDGSVTVDLVRSTTLFRFKDDIQVKIANNEANDGVVVNVVSRSRVGKGDLGQNPRNIRELFETLATK